MAITGTGLIGYGLYRLKNRKINTINNRVVLTSEDGEGGFVDLRIPIKEVRVSDTHRYIEMLGNYNSSQIGFMLQIPLNLEAGLSLQTGDLQVNWKQIRTGSFIPTGEQSNAFLKVLGELYGLPAPENFYKSIDFTMLPLHENAIDIKNDYVQTKIFFEGKGSDENHYAEAYLNFNLKEKFIEFNEKDEGYRSALLKNLGTTW